MSFETDKWTTMPADGDVNRTLPYALGPEKSVLSTLLQEPQEFIPLAIEEMLTDRHFYLPAHSTLFCILLDLFSAGKEIELVSLAQRLIDRGKLDRVGGPSALTDLYTYAPSPGHFRHHIAELRNKFTAREILRISNESISEVYDSPDEIPETLERMEREIMAIRDIDASEKPQTIRQAVSVVVDKFQAELRHDPKAKGISTGFEEFDRVTGGLCDPDMIVIGARPSVGKAQPLWSMVLTPRGFVPMGSLVVGDEVIGLDGKPTQVVGIFPQGELEVFEVTVSDGTKTHACGDHLWLTETRDERRYKHSVASVKTTLEISRTIHRPDGGVRNHALPPHSAVVFDSTKHQDLPLHPWLLGALIGDGKLGYGCVCFFKPEEDVQQKVIRLLPSSDTVSKIHGGVRIKNRIRKNHACATRIAIDALGLGVNSHEKFIPKEYLHASIDNRMELLRGLIDTDGSVTTPRNIEYSTTSKKLADDFLYLARSLGIYCSVTSRITKYTYKGERLIGKRSWRITFPAKKEFVSSKKHLSKINDSGRIRRFRRSIIEIKSIGKAECRCIKVAAADSLYLTDGFIPTHNTAILLNIVEHVCIKEGRPTLVFSAEMSTEAVTKRLIFSRAKFAVSQLSRGYEPTRGDLLRIQRASIEVAESKLHIDDKSGPTISYIRAKARRMKREHDIQFIGIDYLGLIKSLSKQSQFSREREISEISAGIKGLAKDLGIPVILLAQLNREVEKRSGKGQKPAKPRMSDLKDSGSIEADADIIGLLSRDDYQAADDPDAIEGLSCLDLVKNRNGATGPIPLTFIADLMRFETGKPRQEEFPMQKPTGRRGED